MGRERRVEGLERASIDLRIDSRRFEAPQTRKNPKAMGPCVRHASLGLKTHLAAPNGMETVHFRHRIHAKASQGDLRALRMRFCVLLCDLEHERPRFLAGLFFGRNAWKSQEKPWMRPKEAIRHGFRSSAGRFAADFSGSGAAGTKRHRPIDFLRKLTGILRVRCLQHVDESIAGSRRPRRPRDPGKSSRKLQGCVLSSSSYVVKFFSAAVKRRTAAVKKFTPSFAFRGKSSGPQCVRKRLAEPIKAGCRRAPHEIAMQNS